MQTPHWWWSLNATVINCYPILGAPRGRVYDERCEALFSLLWLESFVLRSFPLLSSSHCGTAVEGKSTNQPNPDWIFSKGHIFDILPSFGCKSRSLAAPAAPWWRTKRQKWKWPESGWRGNRRARPDMILLCRTLGDLGSKCGHEGATVAGHTSVCN